MYVFSWLSYYWNSLLRFASKSADHAVFQWKRTKDKSFVHGKFLTFLSVFLIICWKLYLLCTCASTLVLSFLSLLDLWSLDSIKRRPVESARLWLRLIVKGISISICSKGKTIAAVDQFVVSLFESLLFIRIWHLLSPLSSHFISHCSNSWRETANKYFHHWFFGLCYWWRMNGWMNCCLLLFGLSLTCTGTVVRRNLFDQAGDVTTICTPFITSLSLHLWCVCFAFHLAA